MKTQNKIFSLLLVVLFVFLISSFFSPSDELNYKDDIYIEVSWFNSLKGDFLFASNYSYAENIGLNKAQQVACINNCSKRLERMMDEEGIIISDSTDVYYKLIDSTRKYHSLESRSTLYDWKPSSFITVRRYGNFTIEGSVIQDSISKCSLFFRMKDNYLTAWAYHIPEKGNSKIFRLNGGKMFIDKDAYTQGIFKATFSFTFENDLNSLKALYWSGKIYTKIEGF
jgi:hypothetical protein